MDEIELRNTIGRNIAKYRKHIGLTQLELAEKLNYSDKAISKWERGDSIPDIFILKTLANMFRTTVDDMMRDQPKNKFYIGLSIEKRLIIPAMAVVLIFILATLAFGIIMMFQLPVEKAWLCFIFAIPTASTCVVVFCSIWGRSTVIMISISFLVWSVALSLFLTFNLPNNYFFFIIAGLGQLIIVLWLLLIKLSKKRKRLQLHENSLIIEPANEKSATDAQ